MRGVRIAKLNREGKVKAIDQTDVIVVCSCCGASKGELGETGVARSGVLALEAATVAGLAGALSVGVKGALTTSPETAANPRCRQRRGGGRAGGKLQATRRAIEDGGGIACPRDPHRFRAVVCDNELTGLGDGHAIESKEND